MNNHPIHSKDADTSCTWLCLSAGNRSNKDNREIEKALDNLNCRKPKLVPYVDMIARVK